MSKPFALVSLSFVTLSLAGCASALRGNYAYPIDIQGHLSDSPATISDLVIRGRELNDLSSPYFGVLEISFENPTSRWIRVTRIGVDFRNRVKNAGVHVTLGEDAESWARATLQRNAVRQANTASGLEALAVSGALAQALAPKTAVGQAGAAVAVGALGAAAVDEAAERASYAEDVPLSPSYHLFAVPISVPPNLFSKRWLLLNTDEAVQSSCVRGLTIDFETEAGPVEHVWLAFRGGPGRSEWQRAACYKNDVTR